MQTNRCCVRLLTSTGGTLILQLLILNLAQDMKSKSNRKLNEMIDFALTNSTSKKITADIYRKRSEFLQVFYDIDYISRTAQANNIPIDSKEVDYACEQCLILHGWLINDYLAELKNYDKTQTVIYYKNNPTKVN